MSIGPVNPGRLSQMLTAMRLNRSLSSSNQTLVDLQDQVATGQKFLRPSDAPSDAIHTLELQVRLERQSQFVANTDAELEFLTITENALGTVGDVFNRMTAILQEGIGDVTSPTEKRALADEVSTLIQTALSAANTEHRGDFLFAGASVHDAPFSGEESGIVSYLGTRFETSSRVDSRTFGSRSIDGVTAFGAKSETIGGDLNPGLSDATRLDDLRAGVGLVPGPLTIVIDDGIAPQTETIDLTGAETIGDVRARLAEAFAAGPLTLTVDIDPVGGTGLQLTPSAGTVTVTDTEGSRTASELGLVGGPSAVLTGSDLDPVLTEATGVAQLAANGSLAPFGSLTMTVGEVDHTVDLSAVTTVEELLSTLNGVSPDIRAEISADGRGIAVTSYRSGETFAIGEAGGTTATDLGLRTLTADTSLARLHLGQGVSLEDPLLVTLTDGTELAIDLSAAESIGDVLTTINAAQPGDLVATLNTTGNGITLTDNVIGAGSLSVESSSTTETLGIGEGGLGATIVGDDPNPVRTGGLFQLLLEMRDALNANDSAALTDIGERLTPEQERFQRVRGEVGNRLQFLDGVKNRLLDEEVVVQESLSEVFDADLTEIITQLTAAQTSLQATLEVAAQSQSLTLLNFL